MGYNADLGPGLLELTREVPVAYHCGEDGCGGGLSTQNPDTVLYWNHGTCVSQDMCQLVASSLSPPNMYTLATCM